MSIPERSIMLRLVLRQDRVYLKIVCKWWLILTISFFLGTSAMLVNEGLPKFLVERMEQKINGLAHKKIALLGMTFKPDNDDTRESLSFKLKKELEFKMAEVLPVDPYVEGMMNLREAIDKADGVILGVPHQEFRNLKVSKPYVDCWNIWRS